MKKYLFVTCAFLSLVGMVSCKKSKEDRILEINAYEKKLLDANAPVNYQQADSLIFFLTEFVQDFPEDSLSPVFLFKAADIAMNTSEFQNSVNLYDEIILQYPNFEKLPECFYLKGFAFEQMGNIEKAREAYMAFIQKFPEHTLAPDAQTSIDYLGISPEELIRKFEQKNQDSLQLSKK